MCVGSGINGETRVKEREAKSLDQLFYKITILL